MPSVYYDADVSGVGSASLSGGNQVLYVACDITTVGPRTSLIEPALSDHLLRMGWFSLGSTFDAGEGSATHWLDIQWINFLQTFWNPLPAQVASSVGLVAIADTIRWWFSDGTLAHLHVFGV
jgi:hypothetical protein